MIRPVRAMSWKPLAPASSLTITAEDDGSLLNTQTSPTAGLASDMKAFFGGSRTWLAQGPVELVMMQLPPGTIVVHGGARGLDNIAGYVAEARGFEIRVYPALAKGRKWPEAGILRNQEMIEEEHPDKDGVVLDKAYLFHEDPLLGKGTKDMRRRLDLAVPPIEIFVHIGRGR